jgi:hypothetical protein
MGRTACKEPQCLYKGDLYLYFIQRLKPRFLQLDMLNAKALKFVDLLKSKKIIFVKFLCWILSRQQMDMLICSSKYEVQEDDQTNIWMEFHSCITFEACTKESKSFVIFSCQEFRAQMKNKHVFSCVFFCDSCRKLPEANSE